MCILLNIIHLQRDKVKTNIWQANTPTNMHHTNQERYWSALVKDRHEKTAYNIIYTTNNKDTREYRLGLYSHMYAIVNVYRENVKLSGCKTVLSLFTW